ncbi:cell division protein FtsZ [Sulfuriroseicoccus oceanibius]|uniref:Cell division protein FtsZ n=1 Tax=Sulfuriroseicoccus oceanibius TaxID=2707525 RepID=A0A6B3L8A6_9BACT|nr:cell division protein FtsZ [Sulfuriroseicoccus oceanibius]QQL46073.1 hypothetical protein G3M56_005690 [Sulfuriroseicoccus oceanibius]
MIEFSSNPQREIPSASATAAKVIGVGGAGINVIDRLAMESMEGAGLLALHTDVRALANTVTTERVQLGKKLTHGLGAGGDPEIGRRAAIEATDDILAEVSGHRMVFVCAGLGGGTGSGAAPEVVRIAREAGAFVVAFATMPFRFEGGRRQEQAEQALQEMRREANALITFDNDRMGELIVESEGIQRAFEAADNLIAESVRGVSNLVTRPGLIKIGLDDLLTALRNSDSRCLFGSGRASGDKRGKEALRKALNSPLLMKGKMFSSARNILVHVTGGEDLRLHEIDGLMRELAKSVPADAQLLFGAAVDPSMKKELSVTLFSSLAHGEPQEEEVQTKPAVEPIAAVVRGVVESPAPVAEESVEDEPVAEEAPVEDVVEEAPVAVESEVVEAAELPVEQPEPEVEPEAVGDSLFAQDEMEEPASPEVGLFDAPAVEAEEEPEVEEAAAVESIFEQPEEEVAEPEPEPVAEQFEPEVEEEIVATVVDDSVAGFDDFEETVEPEEPVLYQAEPTPEPEPEEEFFNQLEGDNTVPVNLRSEEIDESGGPFEAAGFDDVADDDEAPLPGTQSQLELDRPASDGGRFAKSEPTIVDGEDLDTPAFLRKRNRR